ncbi:Ankyrin repeat-containing domain protein, partial [Elaphomyces granulatus]
MQAAQGHSAIVELLLAVVNINADARGRHLAYTPLISTCEWGHISIVQQLLARTDVDFNACGRGYHGTPVTPLIAACCGRHLKIINLLLAKESIDINLAHAGTTPFIAAARMEANRGARFPDVVKLLLDQQGIDVNYQDNSVARYNCVESAKLLLERDDINVNIPDSEGWTVLHWTCY